MEDKDKQICGNCKHWNKWAGHVKQGDCQRHSPRYLEEGNDWAIVGENLWCGGFEYQTEPNGDSMSASEALFGLMAWLTTRKQRVVFSASDNASVAVDLISEFCKVNSLTKPRENWTTFFKMPEDPDG